MKTVGEFYKELGYPEQDKFDRKANHFTYYDLIDFAEEYANHRVKAKLEEAAENIKKIRDKPHHGIENREKSYLKLGLNLAIEQLESITNTPLK